MPTTTLPDNLPDEMTLHDAAKLGGYTDTATLRQAALRKSFKARKSGGTWMVDTADFLRWLEEDALGPREKE